MTGKFGWSLPPGVTTLPGESADEQAAEALADAIVIALVESKLIEADATSVEIDRAIELLMELVDKAYGDGYRAGQADEAMARELTKPPEEGLDS
jgi:hypothetical protein